MARTRAFDEEEVLSKAMAAFWRRGYHATSLDELLEAMGLSKSSFYETFGSKRDVLIEALRRYASSGMEGILAPLLEPEAARAEIDETFARLVRYTTSMAGRRGCLVNNCIVEGAGHEPKVLEATREILGGREDLLAAAIKRGQDATEIASDESPRALARFLANAMSGINVLARANPGKAALEDVVRVTLAVLDAPARRRRKSS